MKKLYLVFAILIASAVLFTACNKSDTPTPTGGSGSSPVTTTFSSNPNKTIAPNDWTNDSINTNISLGINAQNVSDVKLNLTSLEGVTVSYLRFALVHKGIEVFVIDTPLTVTGSGNMTNTILSDSGHTSINGGTYPFTGTFRPQIPLSSFINSDPGGYWTLKIYNSGSFRTGVIKSWSITITYSPTPQILTMTSAYLPMIGDIQKYKLCDTNNVIPGPGGANATWDFSNISILPDENIDEWVQPVMSPMFWRFPQSNLATRTLGDPNDHFAFFKVDLNNTPYFQGYGDADSTNGLDLYEWLPSIKFAKGPITFGTVNTDNGRVHQIHQSSGITIWGIYNDTITGDGYGTLILPGNITYNNVLRQRSVIAEMDTTNGTMVSYGNMQIYSWYTAGYKFPVFRIMLQLTYSPAFGTRGRKTVSYTTQNVPVLKK